MDSLWRVRVQAQDFDPDAEIAALEASGAGAVVSFVGVARHSSDGLPVEAIELEHYPGMTERSLQEILARARGRFALQGACIIHRHGRILAGQRIVFAAAASAHRDAAFDACRFLVDYLKTEAPFWKRECGAQGSRWVQARHSDAVALERWSAKEPPERP